ncbi:hypothetical protein DEO27_002085 [Mucilaginibacter rubeus]|uniref:Alpha-L-rhamnosidase six-hairpin glycosidase domain-containing protein n=2 Tax=Mucilaginibacter rubeus TaxID=2027860 RepID=A0A5C1HTK0_9SPHI|nr:hypothetical protein DEO27_002085 [Mucilaginibacter rubeus]
MALMKYKASLLLLLFVCFNAVAQPAFTSSDKAVEKAFNWAKEQALHYRGGATDPVGPWYESALPPRSAFCMRDVSHQCIGAEVLGLSRENINMFNLFAGNISQSKDWCSYWEINKWNKPAPDDYRNDKEFWYNLPANFDVLNASWRMYLWTGNRHYIDAPAFVNFQQRSVNEYINSWVLAADSLLKRPAHPNAPVPYNESDSFHRCRGLPSYSEGVQNLKTGVDLVAALYRGMITYSDILTLKGKTKEAAVYAKKAQKYLDRLEADWWSDKDNQYYTYHSNTGQFGKDEGETFLLWFDALKDSARAGKTLDRVTAARINVENMSYYPFLFYKFGRWEKARDYILLLSDPSTARREYPEVSYGIVEGVVQGLMGISPDARTQTLSTIYKTDASGNAAISDVPLLNTNISLDHLSGQQSAIKNTGGRSFKWKAMFYGSFKHANVNGKAMAAKAGKDLQNKAVSFVETTVNPNQKVNIKVY